MAQAQQQPADEEEVRRVEEEFEDAQTDVPEEEVANTERELED